MRLLYIEACPRGKDSRTRKLGEAFVQSIFEMAPQTQIVRHDVAQMKLLPLNGPLLTHREAMIDARRWEDGLFDAAKDFASADRIVIAAPYWDLQFPAMLKVYIEHVCIRELTFRYEKDVPIGLCRAKRAAFLTTAGSPMAGADFGTEYLRAILAFLGIGQMDAIKGEGLDLYGANAMQILRTVTHDARTLARTFMNP